jgi:glycosyltransferase involved in cell wall biosynthesis
MIYVMPVDEWGCGYYRLIWATQVLKHRGLGVKLIQPGKHRLFLTEDNKVVVPPDTELVVMQRPASVFHVLLTDALRKAGIAVVIDMDDDITAIDPKNFAYTYYRHSKSKHYSWRYTVEACQQATFVTTSTPGLLDVYGVRDRGVVLPNCVPAAYLTMAPSEMISFGWSGNTLSHYNDLTVMNPAPQRLIDEGYVFNVVGGDEHIATALRLREAPPMTGDIGIFEWASTIRDYIGVGIVPLANTKFNRGKSWLKGIEYMAMGIPWIASPREEYRRLRAKSGCGTMAETPKQWYEAVKKLLDDKAFRQAEVEAGRAFMQGLTYEAQAWRWAEAWDTAIKLQRGRMT